MKKYDVFTKSGDLIMTYIVYDKKVDKKLLSLLKKNKQINVSEVKND